MTKTERLMLRIAFCWALAQIIVAAVVLLSGCTPHHAHKIWDGYTIENGWTTTRASE